MGARRCSKPILIPLPSQNWVCLPPSRFSMFSNVDEQTLGNPAKQAELAALVAPAKAVFLDAKVESELIDLDKDEAAELLASMGQEESGLDQLAHIGFETLGLQTYLTAAAQRSAGVDDPPWLESSSGGRSDSH